MNACRCCGAEIAGGPILLYSAMPSIIQNLPLEKTEALRNVVDLEIMECDSCGLVQLGGGYVVPYYKDVIRSSAVSKEMMSFRREQFSRFSEKHGCIDKRYVEIGCGRGEYLGIMKDIIRNTVGIENNHDAVVACRATGLDVLEGYIEDLEGIGLADSFGCFNFLEHIPQPVHFLKKIRAMLSDGAVGIVEVPNFDMMGSEGVSTDFSCEHLSYFTTASLQTALMLAGFDVLSMTKVWHGHIISAEVAPRAGLNVSRFEESLEFAKRQIHEVIDGVDSAKIAVWGAGHQSMTMMLQLEIADRIGLIVDSAKMKQGRYAPGIGVKILAPDAMADKGIELLIINASSYSQEVLKDASGRFPFIKDIYVWDNMRLMKGK